MSCKKNEWGPNMVAYKIVHSGAAQKEPPDVEWFKVVYDKVLIKAKPNKDSPSLTMVPEGTLLQVCKARSVDSEGRVFVELTPCEVWRLCPGSSSTTRGFALVDGNSLDLPQLLAGPLDQAEYERLTRALPPALFPALPDRLEALVESFERQGYVHVPQAGVDPRLLTMIEPELRLLESEMKGAQQHGVDFIYRMDRKLFFDTSADRKRSDIPGLNQLVGILETFVELLSEWLSRSQLQLHITGRCRPMVARYDSGGFYVPHVDNANGDGRVLTLCYYLNKNWDGNRDAGNLCLYPHADRRALGYGLDDHEPQVEIAPSLDTLAIFRADWMVHKVQASNRNERFALTLWFNGQQGSPSQA
eukprot:gnl/TRDRNA2_/TRDRNA2_158316_c1_seq2.p1 gnl/TRDRNA2_/TRDRNA2_158316_c1~~gnl/TRDRNA2_/TRDRNA2_158316_c1_seq2.p1  ORF type:complete len:360 (+),score=40.90 gnl/TRDRNA2_/TRDRNA2_158316_c1_seq2:3-1082(+)